MEILMASAIPYFYFPTSILAVDDDSQFLRLITLESPQNMNIVSSTSPEKVLMDIEKNHRDHHFSDYYDPSFFGINTLDAQGYQAYYDFKKIILREDRCKLITLLVTDLLMPKMSGIDLCKKLNNLLLKKILLTGKSDHKLGVAFLNKKLIDKFVLKDFSESGEKLFDYISELQKSIFMEFSMKISSKLYAWQTCQHIGELFNTFVSNYGIVEYYLYNSSGSYIAYSNNGKKYYFVVLSEQEIADFINIAIDQSAPDHIVSQLQERTSVIFFPRSMSDLVTRSISS